MGENLDFEFIPLIHDILKRLDKVDVQPLILDYMIFYKRHRKGCNPVFLGTNWAIIDICHDI